MLSGVLAGEVGGGEVGGEEASGRRRVGGKRGADKDRFFLGVSAVEAEEGGGRSVFPPLCVVVPAACSLS